MRPDTERVYHERILRVLVHIQERLDEELPLEVLARVADFSPYHFHRIFRGLVGEGVKEHVRRLRLERTAHRLKFGDLAVTTIAFDAGYETHESFTRAFRDMFGDSPTGFREAHRALPFKEVPSRVHYRPEGRLEEFQPARAGGGTMDVRIEKVRPMRLAFMRHVGPISVQLPAACFPLKQEIASRPPGAERFRRLAIEEIHRHANCLAGERLLGPYEKLGERYVRLSGEWLPASGREAADRPCLEIYRNSPQDARPEDLLTDIYLPLKE